KGRKVVEAEAQPGLVDEDEVARQPDLGDPIESQDRLRGREQVINRTLHGRILEGIELQGPLGPMNGDQQRSTRLPNENFVVLFGHQGLHSRRTALAAERTMASLSLVKRSTSSRASKVRIRASA